MSGMTLDEENLKLNINMPGLTKTKDKNTKKNLFKNDIGDNVDKDEVNSGNRSLEYGENNNINVEINNNIQYNNINININKNEIV